MTFGHSCQIVVSSNTCFGWFRVPPGLFFRDEFFFHRPNILNEVQWKYMCDHDRMRVRKQVIKAITVRIYSSLRTVQFA